jgi:ribosome biogenesis GTPase A
MAMSDPWDSVRDVIEMSDIILEVADARMPNITRNLAVEKRIVDGGKVFILVLNKSDLVTRRMMDSFLYHSKSKHVAYVSCKDRKGIGQLKKMIFDIAWTRRKEDVLNVGVVGYPNTGKSTLINALIGKSSASTSPISGSTRSVKYYIGKRGLAFYDSPGVIALEGKDDSDLAIMSVIDPGKVEDPEVAAVRILEIFLEDGKSALEGFYGLKLESGDPQEVLQEIGRKRNCLKKGGEVDTTRISIAIISDWQRGKLLLNRTP